ncbi:MAG TPA: branched-chain amino acid ABC transporter permease, partial [Hyphomicrobiales bacterium]|nr:branched-chain amino acid ABC transporter permease [Hyphomicrobiales bacterium]
MTAWLEVFLGGIFHAAVLFLVAAGLQLVFGVQKILNLACGSFYALGAYFAISAVGLMTAHNISIVYFFPVIVASGLLIGLIGLPVEALLRTVYRREESYQLLLTFGLLLMFQDAIRFVWGATPRTMEKAYLAYGTLNIGGAQVPVYNLMVIAASIA